MPEGDSLHRAARRLQVLVGRRVNAEAPHPRGATVAAAVDGRRLLSARAVGKNLLLEFEDGVVVRSHLRMRGRWRVGRRGFARSGRPWLVLAGGDAEAVLWNGPVLQLEPTGLERIGPDILDEPPELDRMIANLRATPQVRRVGEALLDQKLVSGIGNMWRAEGLWQARLSPSLRLGDVADDDLRRALDETARLMRNSLDGGRPPRAVYRRSGRPCPRCGEPI